MHLSSLPYMPHALANSLFLIWSPKSYFMRTTNHGTHCYAIYSIVKHRQLKFLPQCKRPSFTPIYNKRQKYILKLYFNLVLFNSQLNYKRFWTKCQHVLPRFNLVLISSWMQFWFVTAIPKYFNFATLSKDLLLIMLDMHCQKSEADGSDRNPFCSIQQVYVHISWPLRATVLRYNYKTFYFAPH